MLRSKAKAAPKPLLQSLPKAKPQREERYTPFELHDLRAEETVAREMNIPWQQRGPPGPEVAGETWRGQKWRQGSHRWGNNGGSNRDWYAHYSAIKRSRDTAKMEEFLEENAQKFRLSDTAKGPIELRKYLARHSSQS